MSMLVRQTLSKINLKASQIEKLSHKAFCSRQIHISIPTMVQAKKFIYEKRFDGLPKLTDFRLAEENLPAVGDGGDLFIYLFNCVFCFYF